ncbi:hypothetical protein O159_27420 [Leifsonia xyli subsp. cynodontis DSM 46306]|jgi:hypothetical protein|uniref:Uncharacterized protein n=1 Tax=Leifsonia xyli subsp. cynodontis DSM 46306 TaxID=1389489 RepID=U3PG34_LEIXC|nr:hypothetical protein [Leifsonia xyli]AGW42633.1 hypothetical protein O159_27420 [Leifsonia xyli subsp. cynodontis DSM 46306]
MTAERGGAAAPPRFDEDDYDTRMKTALRTALGWIAAVFVNLGALLLVAGILVPRTNGSPALDVGIGMLAAGAIAGVGWTLGGGS